MTAQQTINVWDPLIRVFHWSLVAAFTIAYITEEDFLSLHSWAGYIVLTLILLRIVWGVIGSPHARFRDFIYSPTTIKQFLKDTLTGRAKRYIGHNPAGGAMILLLLLALLMTGISGLIVYGMAENAGPLAGWLTQSSHDTSEIFEEIHEFFANFTVFLVVIHIAGVVIESLIHKENLVKAMIDGEKRINPQEHTQ